MGQEKTQGEEEARRNKLATATATATTTLYDIEYNKSRWTSLNQEKQLDKAVSSDWTAE